MPQGSCLVKFGDTHVAVAPRAVEERVPPWLPTVQRAGVTAEYGMLPRSTVDRMRREATSGKTRWRTLEIQRPLLAARSCSCSISKARAAPDHRVDCDVIQADAENPDCRPITAPGSHCTICFRLKWMKARSMAKLTGVLKDHCRGRVFAAFFAAQSVCLISDYLKIRAADGCQFRHDRVWRHRWKSRARRGRTFHRRSNFGASELAQEPGIADLVEMQKEVVAVPL